MKSKKIFVENFSYVGRLATISTRVEIVLQSESILSPNQAIADLPANCEISEQEILRLERLAACKFFEETYRLVLNGERELQPHELTAIMRHFELNARQFAELIGIKKSSISNNLSGKRKMSRPTQILIMERLGLGLSRRGSLKALLYPDSHVAAPADDSLRGFMDSVRFLSPFHL